MWMISQKRLREFWANCPDAERPLREWYRTARNAEWSNLSEVRKTYPHADGVTIACRDGRRLTATVFDIGGNKYRVVTLVFYKIHRVYIEAVLTHKEYDFDKWKARICRD